MDLFVVRGPSEDTGTPGVLSVPEVSYTCDTLELPWLNNIGHESCVVADTYKCWLWFSPHLQRMVLRLEDKNGRTDCLVHNANFAGNVKKGLYTQLLGCTAPGSGYGQLTKPDGSGTQYGIKNSKVTLSALLEAIGNGPHTITFSWGTGSAPADLTDRNQEYRDAMDM